MNALRGAFDVVVDLGFVRHRLAVPYLERLAMAKSPVIRVAGIEGLGQAALIAPAEATEALLRVMQGGLDEEDRRRSLYILNSIGRTAQSGEVHDMLVKPESSSLSTSDFTPTVDRT